MTKFYVKITDEAPSVDDDALWFAIDSDLQDSQEFFVLGRNEYNKMHDDFISAKENLESSEVLSTAINNMMNSGDLVVPKSLNSDNSVNLVNPDDHSSFFTWSSLTNKFRSFENDLSNFSSVVADKVSSEQLSSTVSSLKGLINGKANASHPHKRWVRVSASSYGRVYYNEDLQMCFFRYYRGNDAQCNIAKTWTSYNIYSMGDSKYYPIESTHLNTHNKRQYAHMDSDGKLYVGNIETTGKQNVNISGFWLCKGATTN